MSSLEGMVIADFSRMLTAGHVVTEVGNRGTATHAAARTSAEPLPANPATALAKLKPTITNVVTKAETRHTATHAAARTSAEPLPANAATMLAAASEKPRANVAHVVTKATTPDTTPKGRVA
jgi:hypothetical protein